MSGWFDSINDAAGLGTVGAKNKAQAAAMDAQAAAYKEQSALQKRTYEDTRRSNDKYGQIGSTAIAALMGKPQTYTDVDGNIQTYDGTNIAGLDKTALPDTYDSIMGNAPKYSDSVNGRTFDETMAGYDPATAVERERKVGALSLGNQMGSRGIRGMNSVNKLADFNDQKEAELSNRQLAFNKDRYAARTGEANTMYANTRAEATQRLAGLRGDYDTRKAQNQDNYNRLSQMVGWGMGAQNNAGQANNQYSQQASQTAQNFANNKSNSALMGQQMDVNAQNNNVQNLMQGIGTGIKAYQAFKGNGSTGGNYSNFSTDDMTMDGVQDNGAGDYSGGGQ